MKLIVLWGHVVLWKNDFLTDELSGSLNVILDEK